MTNLNLLEVGVLALVISKVFIDIFYATVKDVVNKIKAYLLSKLYVSMLINKEDNFNSFALIQEWLIHHPYTQKCSSTTVIHSRILNEKAKIPAAGNHYIRHESTIFNLVFTTKKASAGINSDEYKITTFWFNKNKLDAWYEFIQKYEYKEKQTNLTVWKYSPGGSYIGYGRKRRSLNTIYMDEATKAELVAAIKNFLGAETYYDAQGIPYGLGILMYGAPGGGKTSSVVALATEFNLPIYTFSLSNLTQDDLSKILYMASPCILLLEDIDTFTVAQNRTPAKTDWKDKSGKEIAGLSLSDLLNAIDGILTTPGRILIMTTNHKEKLDPALIRSGRIDVEIEIKELSDSEVGRMFGAFFPDHKEFIPSITKMSGEHKMVAADWQKVFIKYKDKPEELFKHLKEGRDGKVLSL